MSSLTSFLGFDFFGFLALGFGFSFGSSLASCSFAFFFTRSFAFLMRFFACFSLVTASAMMSEMFASARSFALSIPAFLRASFRLSPMPFISSRGIWSSLCSVAGVQSSSLSSSSFFSSSTSSVKKFFVFSAISGPKRIKMMIIRPMIVAYIMSFGTPDVCSSVTFPVGVSCVSSFSSVTCMSFTLNL